MDDQQEHSIDRGRQSQVAEANFAVGPFSRQQKTRDRYDAQKRRDGLRQVVGYAERPKCDDREGREEDCDVEPCDGPAHDPVRCGDKFPDHPMDAGLAVIQKGLSEHIGALEEQLHERRKPGQVRVADFRQIGPIEFADLNITPLERQFAREALPGAVGIAASWVADAVHLARGVEGEGCRNLSGVEKADPFGRRSPSQCAGEADFQLVAIGDARVACFEILVVEESLKTGNLAEVPEVVVIGKSNCDVAILSPNGEKLGEAFFLALDRANAVVSAPFFELRHEIGIDPSFDRVANAVDDDHTNSLICNRRHDGHPDAKYHRLQEPIAGAEPAVRQRLCLERDYFSQLTVAGFSPFSGSKPRLG